MCHSRSITENVMADIVVAWVKFICIEEHGHMYRKCV